MKKHKTEKPSNKKVIEKISRSLISQLWMQNASLDEIAKTVGLTKGSVKTIIWHERKLGNEVMFPSRKREKTSEKRDYSKRFINPNTELKAQIQRISTLWIDKIPVKEIARQEGKSEKYLHVWIIHARKIYPDLFPKRPPGGFNPFRPSKNPKIERLKPIISSLWLQNISVDEIAAKVGLKPEYIRTIAYVERKLGNEIMFPKRLNVGLRCKLTGKFKH